MFIAVSVSLVPSLKERPISLAFFAKSESSSFPTVPAIDCTLSIPTSKSLANFVQATPTPAIGTVNVFVIFKPTFSMFLPAFSISFPALIICFELFVRFPPTCFKGADILSISLRVTSINFPDILSLLHLVRIV